MLACPFYYSSIFLGTRYTKRQYMGIALICLSIVLGTELPSGMGSNTSVTMLEDRTTQIGVLSVLLGIGASTSAAVCLEWLLRSKVHMSFRDKSCWLYVYGALANVITFVASVQAVKESTATSSLINRFFHGLDSYLCALAILLNIWCGLGISVFIKRHGAVAKSCMQVGRLYVMGFGTMLFGHQVPFVYWFACFLYSYGLWMFAA